MIKRQGYGYPQTRRKGAASLQANRAAHQSVYSLPQRKKQSYLERLVKDPAFQAGLISGFVVAASLFCLFLFLVVIPLVDSALRTAATSAGVSL